MSYPPSPGPADRERPETSWLSGSLSEGEPASPHGGTVPVPTQPQPWQAGPVPYQQTPVPAGQPSGYPPLSPGTPAPRKSSGGKVVAAVVAAFLVGAGAGIGGGWQLWHKGGTSSATTPTPTSTPTCWDPAVTGECPPFAGRDAALYVFPLKDKADEASCTQVTIADFENSGSPAGAVDVYKCRFDDLGTSAFLTQWPSPDAATKAWMTLPSNPDLPWYAFQERWTVDDQEMGDLLVGPDTGSGNEFHAQCYDDLPFCMWTLGQTGKGGTGEDGDWTLVRDKFGALNTQEVGALNSYLTDHPTSTSTPQPTSTSTPTPTTGNQYEVTSLSSIERSVQGQLAKGYCFGDLPNLHDALTTPVVVDTVPCADPHQGQVLGFVDITDLGSGEDDSTQSQYRQRCQDLMSAENVPNDLQAYSHLYFPNPQEVQAGVGVAMCLVHSTNPWTGSALDGTATGY